MSTQPRNSVNDRAIDGNQYDQDFSQTKRKNRPVVSTDLRSGLVCPPIADPMADNCFVDSSNRTDGVVGPANANTLSANQLLQQFIGEGCFELWFGGDNSLTVEDQIVIVKTSDEFSMERIKASYTNELNNVVQEGKFDGLTFQCEKQMEPVLTSPKKQPSEIKNKRQIDLFDVGRSKQTTKTKNSVANSGGRNSRQSSGLLATFVVDPENEIVWRACQQVIKSPGELSPFYLYGSSGSGKTHLLEGITADARKRSRNGKVLYLTAEKFTTEFVGSLKARAMPMFRKRFRELDFFIIDDIQFLDGKQSTLVELQHTIEAVVKRGGQVVISADRSPSELEFAGPDFINRIACGLSCEIALASEATKRKIVRRIAKTRAIKVKTSILDYIAAEVSGDIRLLSGALNRVKAFQTVKGELISLEEAKYQLRDLVGVARKSVSITEIEKAVCNMFGLEKASLRSSSKVKAISQPRMLAMWLSRKYTRAALSEIGNHFGGRSHSTVISAQSKVEKWVTDGELIGIRHSEFPVCNALRRIEHELRVG